MSLLVQHGLNQLVSSDYMTKCLLHLVINVIDSTPRSGSAYGHLKLGLFVMA